MPSSESGGSHNSRDDEASPAENCGWYMYDFANSPYFQVYIGPILPVLLKWLAEKAALQQYLEENPGADQKDVGDPELLPVPVLGITAGSYPLVVNVITCFFQVLCLLSCSAYADYGTSRKTFLIRLTWAGAFVTFLNVFCLSGSLWWLAGVLRVVSGIFFVLCIVYYNAFLPVLADSQPEVIELRRNADQALQDTKSEVLDMLSSRGMMVGYAGGATMSVIAYAILIKFECLDQTGSEGGPGEAPEPCSEFDIFFWPNVCIGIVAVWWLGFSQVCFATLEPRPGPELDGDVNILCFGWQQTCDTLGYVFEYRNMLYFIVAYFIYSDAYNTICTVAPLILESEMEATISDTMFYAFLIPIVMIFGIWMYRRIQVCFDLSTKSILLIQLMIYAGIALLGGMKVISNYGTAGLYAVFVPAMVTLGSIQANSRSLFAELIPPGMEAAMFAFYEITDKGSNFIGTGVSAVVHNHTHSYEGTFWYILPAVLFASVSLWFVDVRQAYLDAEKKAMLINSSGHVDYAE